MYLLTLYFPSLLHSHWFVVLLQPAVVAVGCALEVDHIRHYRVEVVLVEEADIEHPEAEDTAHQEVGDTDRQEAGDTAHQEAGDIAHQEEVGTMKNKRT